MQVLHITIEPRNEWKGSKSKGGYRKICETGSEMDKTRNDNSFYPLEVPW